MANDFGITLDDAISELQYHVEEAINFMWSEFENDWALAERYYAGGCDLPTDEGRSDAVKTEVRDVIRGIMPNLMRVLYQARKPVEYIPTHIQHAAFIDQQALFAEQRFKACGGYKILYNAVLQALKLKIGPIKVWYETDPAPKYMEMTALTQQEVDELKELPDFEVKEVEDHPKLGENDLYNVKGYQYYPYGRICIEDFPVYEFFVSRNATNLEDARVHGHHREVTVAEAIEMGLDYPNWEELQGSDPENKYAAESSRARRGYSPDEDEDDSEDLLQKKILLTEVYCKYDLDGDGVEERYCFYLGGSTYKYIDHYEIEDYCIEVVNVDPQPYTVIGRSIADMVIEKQDNETSILRAIIDNAHMANNPRFAADPNKTDFNDLMNNAIGGPIKTLGSPDLQVVDIPFTGASLIPFLQYMEQDTEERVGMTKAARGLDPDALQSTDKDAVLNTIQLSQGQIELMARNVVETGLIGIFQKLLRLCQRHMDRYQVVRSRGMLLPIDLAAFDTELAAEPNVGLGTASHEEKLATLNFILQKQEQIISMFGMDNPFTSLSQMYNTLEDIVDLGGLKDPGRYFKVVTEQMEQTIAQRMKEAEAAQAQQAQQMQPMDPGLAMLESEKLKAQASFQGDQLDYQADMAKLKLQEEEMRMKADIERDKMVQDRVIKLREIGAQREAERIKREQEANDAKSKGRGTSGSSGEQTSQQQRPQNSVDSA